MMMAAVQERLEGTSEENMKNSLALSLVVVHFAVLVVHGASHAHLSIGASAWQKAFIGGVIFAAPLIATVLLWTRMRELGVLLLGLSLTGSLVFGVRYHFLVAGADSTGTVPFSLELSVPSHRHPAGNDRGRRIELVYPKLAR